VISQLEIGKFNTLKVVKTLDFGAYLDGGNGLEILLPIRYVPAPCEVGDDIDVFIYHDNEGRLIATTVRPLAIVGEFRLMHVKDVTQVGAFLEWGIMKDLLVPYREQKMQMMKGRSYLVYVYLDNVTNRIVASARLDKFLDNTPPQYEYNQEVDLIVADESEIGYKVIINHLHYGLLYRNEVFRTLTKGEKLKGYIKDVREDNKIDVSLHKLGYEKIDVIAQQIMFMVEHNGGFLPLHDKSDANIIRELFACSKKSFKQAVGALYKQKLIALEKDGIRLLRNEE
jgi:predicted RNA-binding protein (virulence factor B family)